MSGIAAALIPALIKVGAPRLAALLRGRDRAVAGDVLQSIADSVGARETTEEAVWERAKEVPDVFSEEVTRLEDAAREIEAFTALARDEVKSEDAFVRRGRPFVLWTFGINCLISGLTVSAVAWNAIWTGDSGLIADLLPLAGPLGTQLITHAGVAGYYVRQRTVEKEAGVA